MPGIFISYRRDDSAAVAGRLFDHLIQHFGEDYVFRDVELFIGGSDCVDAIKKALGSCDVLLAVIGRKWVTCTNESGKRRIDDPNDFLRIAIATAFSRNVRVVPVLVEGAQIPSAEALPDDLKPLAHRNAIELRDISDTRWNVDVQNLIHMLDRRTGRSVPAEAALGGLWAKLKRVIGRDRVPRVHIEYEVDQSASSKRPQLEPGPMDDVKLGAAALESASPGQEFIAHFVAYPAGQEEETRKMLEAQSPDVTPVLGKRTCRWAQGTVVNVRVRGDYLEIEHPEQSFTWNGAIESLDFSGRVGRNAPVGNVVLKYDVLVANFLVAALRLTMRISTQAGQDKRVTATTYAPRTAFASYASQDRSLVTHMVGAIERAAGIDVFQDCLDLRASEKWKPQLNQEIQARDLFMLFWSRAAAASTWVEWEWKTALRDKSKEAIQIHALQPDLSPPHALRDLHFASVHAIVADYYAKRSDARAEPSK